MRRSKWIIDNDEVTRVSNALASIKVRIDMECGRLGDSVSIAVAAYLFCTLVETGMSAVACMMQSTHPSMFTKRGEVNDGTGFAWSRTCRADEASRLTLINGQTSNVKLRNRLAEASMAWIPYRTTGNGIVYTKISYFFGVVRHIRNVGTHRSLEPTETVEVADGTSGAQALTQTVSHMWIPYNPAAKEYIEAETVAKMPPNFTQDRTREHKDCGFVKVTNRVFIEGLLDVSNDVHMRIGEMIATFRV
jgi:hypothetical protein